ncbi:hypothetical protein WJU16_05965 [Chitinophaga pollutisoli]|uniref:Uncharacterized protein n=1 Tax=Chitinophaga pollutisoli TaxID=3133966 RepID=A0ABZ2YS17_9BACT
MATQHYNNRKTGKHKRWMVYINIAAFMLIAAALVWVLRQYFHLGDSSYTNAAQVEAFTQDNTVEDLALLCAGMNVVITLE